MNALIANPVTLTLETFSKNVSRQKISSINLRELVMSEIRVLENDANLLPDSLVKTADALEGVQLFFLNKLFASYVSMAKEESLEGQRTIWKLFMIYLDVLVMQGRLKPKELAKKSKSLLYNEVIAYQTLCQEKIQTIDDILEVENHPVFRHLLPAS